jgi:hypothetical protein
MVFVILFVVCLRVFTEMGFGWFSGKVLAFCVAALSVMSLKMFAPEQGSHDVSEPLPRLEYFLLLPYAALGLTLAVLPFIFFSYKCLPALMDGGRRQRESNRIPNKSTSKNSGRSTPSDDGRIVGRRHD